MSRRPLHVLSLVSAVVCVLSLGLVGRSFFRMDQVRFPIAGNEQSYFPDDYDADQRKRHFLCIGSTMDGRMTLEFIPAYRSWGYASARTGEVRPLINRSFGQHMTGIRWLGIGWGTTIEGISFVLLPLWLVPVVTAVLPVRWWVIRRRAGGGRGFAVEVGSRP
jgi:hypothetical protein